MAAAFIGDVFALEMRGALVANDRTVSFGHDLLHRFG
jgi:hypothetical protein